MRQYEIWQADLPEPIGRRPVLLLSRAAAYQYLTRVIIAEVTRTIRNIPVEVALGSREGLRYPSVANFDNLHTVAKKRLVSRLGAVGPRRIAEIKQALGNAFDWPELKRPESD